VKRRRRADEAVIAEGWHPGVLDSIVALHAVYYARAWGFGPFFEAKVARELAEFIDRYDQSHDRLFVATAGDRIVGSLVIDGGEAATKGAHLRWFIVDEACRGQGLGARLMDMSMAFVVERKFSRCYLTTFAGLDAARRLYERAGFRLVSETRAATWGTLVTEQQFEWQGAT
jgi:ribosomal protein S18 acetylase RimI-like enzyme